VTAQAPVRPRTRLAIPALHVVAGAVVAAGVVATVVRPVAPPVDPATASAWFEPAWLEATRAYRAPLRWAALGALVLDLAVPLAAALTPPGRRAVDRLLARVGRPLPGGAAVAAAVLLATDLATLPLAFWSGYVHEGVWGFRTQGLGGWVRDWLLWRAPVWAGGAALAAGGLALGRRLPSAAWPAVAGLSAAAVTAAVVLVSPLVLEPLQFRLTPLPDGPVRAAVQGVLDRAGERVDDIVVADASRRTTKENAYVSGLGATRHVVLYDTLVAGRTPAEVASVFAHELGHDRNGDLPRGVALGAAGMVAGAYAVAAVLHRRARGAPGALGDPRGVAAAVAAVAVLAVATLPLAAAVSRRAESAADQAALELTGDAAAYLGLQEGLARANRSDPSPPAWARLLWSTHPGVLERLGRGQAFAAGALR